MADDYKNIRISIEAERVADTLCERFCFESKTAAMRFAMAYALRDFADIMDFENLDNKYPKDGTNLNIGTVDTSDNIIKRSICMMYPECETPYRYARVAIIYGLEKISERMKDAPTFTIADIM